MAARSPYAVSLDQLEAGVHVPIELLVQLHDESHVPHDLSFEDMALGRPPRIFD